MYILANMWIDVIFRNLLFNIDKVVYNFISSLYDLLITIARTSVLTQADIASMADRIYKLLAVFMIFKVTLSLITYVVNPDDFSDKTKGVSKLGTNIIISLALLILTPYLFNYAYQFQTIILEDNSLATLIFGDKANDEFLTTAGDDMAFLTMTPFFTPNVSIPELYECTELTVRNSDGTVVFNPECSGLSEDFDDLNDSNSMMGVVDEERFTSDSLKNYVAGVEAESLPLMFRKDIAVATDHANKNFIIDYKYLFSTVVGVVVVLLLISFCMDVGLRSIKLAFLQLVAPIPIISYVDPKSGKDGLFKKWYQMCFKTYLSLFVRLLALYFAVFIISKVADLKMVDIVDGSYVTNGYVAIFIIIGALMFAKQLPKLLEGLGIKLDGNGFTLNPLRKIEKEALGGKVLKKPNDSLVKFAKGGFGAGTLAKKTLSGMNAAYHGKGFKNGFDRYKGGFGKWVDKQRESYLPYGYEASKKKREGREEVKSMHTKWKKGADAIKGLERRGSYLEDLNGVDSKAYDNAGFKGNFKESKMKLDKAAEQKKIMDRITKSLMSGETLEDTLNAEKHNIKKYGLDKFDLSSTNAVYETSDKIDKTVSGLEKVHESIRKQDSTQADLEDSIKFVKYNNPDPTTGEELPINKRPNNVSNNQNLNSGNLTDGSSTRPSSDANVNSNTNEGRESMPTPEGPADNAEEQQRQNNENDAETIIEDIRKLKEHLKDQEERMKKLIEENEEKINKIEKQLEDTTDLNIKAQLKGQIDGLEIANENYKKQLEEHSNKIKTQIKHLEEQLDLIS